MSDDPGRPRYGAAAACAAAAIVLFQFWGNATRGYIATDSLFRWWFSQWVNPASENEHAWLILALSLFLFGRNLRQAGTQRRSVALRAGAALAAGLALHAVGYVAQQPRISIVALLLCAWGVLALAGGDRWARAAAFPVGFMVFAIPVNALDTVGFWLRLWVVDAGAGIAHAAGIGVWRSGTQLLAPDGRYRYDVVAACSGVRSLMALAALALFIGYLWFRPVWVRAAMLLLCLPLVYAGNVLRIGSIIFAAQWGGQAWGDRVHDVMGLGVFVVVLGGVLAAAEGLVRLRPGWAWDGPGEAPAAGGGRTGGPGEGWVALSFVLLASVVAGLLWHRSGLPLAGKAGVILAGDGVNPAVLPSFLGADWMGTPNEPTAVEKAILPPDTGYSSKLYQSRSGASRRVLLSIVLSGRDRTSIHRPELCLVGQGWTIEGSSLHRFPYPGRPGAGFEATVLNVRRGRDGASVPGLVVYWFVGCDRVVPSQGRRILADAWNRVIRGRADRWAYVLLQTEADDGEAAGLSRIESVLLSALPAFQLPVAAQDGSG